MASGAISDLGRGFNYLMECGCLVTCSPPLPQKPHLKGKYMDFGIMLAAIRAASEQGITIQHTMARTQIPRPINY